MLLSAKEERERRFKLALRAGIPILLLFFLLFFTTFSKGSISSLTLENAFLMGGLVFTTIYFIYFLLELDVKETLLDQTTEGFNHEAFVKKLEKHQPQTVAILVVKNLFTINENYGNTATNGLLHTLVSKLNYSMRTHGIKENWIGRHSGSEFLIALDLESNTFKKLLEHFVQENSSIDGIEIDYRFAIVNHGEASPEKTIALLKDELASLEIRSSQHSEKIKDINTLSRLEQSTIKALEDESLTLYFRPLYHIKRDRVDSYEIAVKLRDTQGREILPKDYLPIINRLGMGRSYDMLSLKKLSISPS